MTLLRTCFAMPGEDADFAPGPDAALALQGHCLRKASQVSSIAGVALVGAASTLRAVRGRPPLGTTAALRLLAQSLAVGTAVIGTATAVKVAGLDEEG